MTAANTMTYNPAFLGEEALVAAFVARGRDLAGILEIVQGNTGATNQHVIVIGPRGIGKTTLVLRVAAELRRDPTRVGGVYPIVFAEESYEVHDAASLWLQALYHLGRQTGAPRWQQAHERLRSETDANRVRGLALAELHEFSEAEGKRLLLIVENINVLVDRQISADEAWTLRHTLLNDPSIMLLATATSRFDGIDRREQAMFDLFRVITLEPLASHECAALWHGLTGATIDERQGRALEILTGGNPRLLAVLSRTVADAPLRTLADDLVQLINDQTPYFKSQIDALSPQAQRVFVVLADLWAPATAQEIAERAGLSVNNVSAVLARLEQDGVVLADAVSRRRKRYQLGERLYNIYYQMRRGGAAAERVRYSIDFIAAYYDAETIVENLLTLAEETVAQSPAQRVESLAAFFGLYDRIAASHAGVPEISDEQRGRLDADPERARADTEWFITLWREWWSSHRILRDGWALMVAQPVAGECWDELFNAMFGGERAAVVRVRIESRAREMAEEFLRIRPALHGLCREVLADSPSLIDVLVVGALAARWLADEGMFRRSWETFNARWPGSPWVQLAYRWFADFFDVEQPRRFVKEVKASLARHPDSVWLPLVAGLILDIEDEPGAASTFYRASPLSERVVALARALAEIRRDFLEYEAKLVLEPRFAVFAGSLAPARWIAFFIWLGRFTAERLARPSDAIEVYQLAAEQFPESIELQLALGSTLFFASPDRADAGLTTLRRASKYDTDAWRLRAAIATVQAFPLGQIEAALNSFATSWRVYLRDLGADERPSTRGWLEPVGELLPGHPLIHQFLTLLRPSRRKLEAALKRLSAGKLRTREHHRELISVVLALATRGHAASLLASLRASSAATSLEPLIVGLALVVGEDVQAPREIAETAHDIAASIRLFSGLFQLVSAPLPP